MMVVSNSYPMPHTRGKQIQKYTSALSFHTRQMFDQCCFYLPICVAHIIRPVSGHCN